MSAPPIVDSIGVNPIVELAGANGVVVRPCGNTVLQMPEQASCGRAAVLEW